MLLFLWLWAVECISTIQLLHTGGRQVAIASALERDAQSVPEPDRLPLILGSG